MQQGLETQRIYLNLRRRGVGTGVGEADVALHLHWRRASQSIDSGGAGNRTILHLFCRVMHTMLLHFREVGLVNRVAKALSISPLKATSAVAVGVGVYDGVAVVTLPWVAPKIVALQVKMIWVALAT